MYNKYGMWRYLPVVVFLTITVLCSNISFADKADDTLRYATKQACAAVDPYYEAHREAVLFNGMMVWDTLIYRDPDTSEYKPLLAKSWSWQDNKTIDFILRENVKFHDGVPFTVTAALIPRQFRRFNSPPIPSV